MQALVLKKPLSLFQSTQFVLSISLQPNIITGLKVYNFLWSLFLKNQSF